MAKYAITDQQSGQARADFAILLECAARCRSGAAFGTAGSKWWQMRGWRENMEAAASRIKRIRPLP